MLSRILSGAIAVFLILVIGVMPAAAASPNDVQQWDVYEATFKGPSDGNPFVDVDFAADFKQGDRTVVVPGFYDGAGTYRVRFTPDAIGAWQFQTRSNRKELDGQTGSLNVTPPSAGNHGPVRVRETQFFYADGTPYRELGTTCYAWIHQPGELQEQTLKTLSGAPFNKLRMCVFPKWYAFNRNEPILYPFDGTAPNRWDFTRLNPAFFQHLEQRVQQLGSMGIEADIILFHPYDKGHWGFDSMGAENDDRYIRYVTARLSAYRNVWWSLADEWDLIKGKKIEDWDRIGELIHKSDPYGRLCSIHQSHTMFDHSRPWITHVSVQSSATDAAQNLIATYHKPVVYDEALYEGNIPQQWGSIMPQRMVNEFWNALIGGGYCGHGETYMDPSDVLWWSKGGVLRGQSPQRLMFYKKIIDDAPANAKAPVSIRFGWGVENEYYLIYYSDRQPAQQTFTLPKNLSFKGELIDTWEMTITPLPGVYSGDVVLSMPGKPYQAIRLILTK